MVKKKEPVKEEKDKLQHKAAGDSEFVSAAAAVKAGGAIGEGDATGDGEKPRKKRRRRTKAELEAERAPQLSSDPNPLFFPLLNAPFNAWAKAIKDERIKLSDEEVFNLALPITQLCDYYFPKTNPIWFSWFNLTTQVYTIWELRQAVIKELRAKLPKKPAGITIKDGSDQPPTAKHPSPEEIEGKK